MLYWSNSSDHRMQSQNTAARVITEKFVLMLICSDILFSTHLRRDLFLLDSEASMHCGGIPLVRRGVLLASFVKLSVQHWRSQSRPKNGKTDQDGLAVTIST